jgi:tetratricopeptide (TPR) repeat protein
LKGRRTGAGGGDKVVSIVEKRQLQRLAEVREQAERRHILEVQTSLAQVEVGLWLKSMDFDAEQAKLQGAPPEVARVGRARLLSARALARCLKGDEEAGFADWEAAIAEAPELAEPWLVRGRWRMTKDPASALTDYDRAAEIEPRSAEVYARRADCLLAAGEPERAIANYRRAIALDPRSVEVLHAAAKLLASRSEHAEAAALADRALALGTPYADLLLVRATARRALGQLDLALEDYTRILALDETRNDVRLLRVVCLERSGRIERALEEALALVARGPDDCYHHATVGRLRLSTEDVEGALAALDRAVQIAPEVPLPYTLRVLARLRHGDVAGALADLDRLVALEPDEPQHVLSRAVLRAHTLPRAEAYAEFDALLERYPEMIMLLEQRAGMLAEDGEHERAILDLDRLLAGAPDDVDSLVARARSRAALGRVAEALEDVAHVLRIEPDHAVAHLLRAIYRDSLEDASPAIEADFDRAVALAPDDPSMFYERAAYRRRGGRYAEAVADLDRVIAMAPAAAAPYLARASCKNQLDQEHGERDPDWEEEEEETRARCSSAIADAERALELGLRDEDIYMELWTAYDQLGDAEREMESLDRGCAALPESGLLLLQRSYVRGLRGATEGAAADRARAAELGFEEAAAEGGADEQGPA